nr:DUF1302 family protein [uncultured Albidiferax sp.]
MKIKTETSRQQTRRVSVVGLTMLAMGSAGAVELVNDEQKTIRWDNSVKYTIGARTTDPSASYLGNLNTNDGDGAFAKRGRLITNRIDVLSEFDLTLKDAHSSGLRLSAAAWYDNVYRRSHDAIEPLAYNPVSVSNTQFTEYARKWAGANAELYDAFVHSGASLGGHNLSWRLGRHTVMWGESLFLATNGIAAGQAPADVTKALTVPGIQTKDFLMPVNQLSGALTLNDNWSLQSYYQLEFRPTRIAAPGTFFSPADVVFNGSERILFAPGMGFPRDASQNPPERSGQWGIATLYRNPQTSWDFGVYYLRYTDKTPQVYTRLAGIPVAPFFVPGSYQFVYPEKIDVLGFSTSTSVGSANVAGEVSVRNNMPLVSNSMALSAMPGMVADGRNNPLHAIGRTLHFQTSTIWVPSRSSLWEAAELVAEVGGNHLLKVTRNETARDTNTSRTTFGAAVQFTPTWYQVLPDLDISLPLNLAYNFNSKPSAVDPGFNGTGAAKGGRMSVGVKFNYANGIKGGVYYTRYLGQDSRNSLGDRDFVTMNLNYSF